MTRFISRAALTLALIVLTTATAWADPTGNWADYKAETVPQSDDGSTLYISTAEQLACYAYGVNNDWQTTGSASGYYCGRTVELMADIDLSAHYWKPIGWNKYYYFNGYFHGNGHVITGVHVNGDPQSDNTQNYPCYGLFGYLHTRSGGTSTITDLVLKDFSITASFSGNRSDEFYLGGLVGRCDDNTAITNCLLVNGSVGKDKKNNSAHIGKVAGGGSPSTATANYYHNVSVSGWSVEAAEQYAQQTIGGETEARAVALTISSTHGSVALGGTVGRISGGIIYAPANETVTLNTTTDAGYIASLAATGLTLTSGQFTMPDNDDGAITATVSIDPAHFSVNDAGTEYTIKTAAGWNVFCDCLNDNDTYNRFSGKTVRLGADITVSRMAGSQYHDFCGTFDGDGNTLTVTLSGSSDRMAPFSYISNVGSAPAAIRNLNVVAAITSSGQNASALVGEAWGELTIEQCTVSGTVAVSKQFAGGIIGSASNTPLNISNCISSVTISSSKSGDGTHGGFAGRVPSSATLNISGCVFDGKIITTSGTTNCGGFVGHSENTAGSNVSITNSLYAPTADDQTVSEGCETFCRNIADGHITNSYYTRALGTAQGKATRTVTAATDVTIEAIALTGDATQYTVSGITAYSGGGLQRGQTLYYGSGDQLSLTLSNSATGAPQGYRYDGYTASAGTLSGSTLTMPDEDVTISLDTSHPRSTGQAVSVSYADAGGASHDAQAIALDGYETVTSQYGSQYIDLAAGWYFVGADIDYTGKCIRPQGDINLILGNGKTMHIGTADNPTHDNGIERSIMDITIYGQSLDNATAGTLSYVGTGDGFKVNNYTQHSGNVSISHTSTWVTYGIDCYNATINGGTFNATGGKRGISTTTTGTVTINGGTVNASGTEYGIYAPSGTITLGWTNATDRIYASSYSGTVSVATADGHKLYDGNGNFLSGTVSDLAALNGKTLQPALSTAYITAQGTAAADPADAIVLSPDQTTLGAHNYVALGTLNYTQTGLTLTGDATLILADNCQMNVGTSEGRINGKGIYGYDNDFMGFHDLIITSQSLGDDMGRLGIYTTGTFADYGIRPGNLTINGGNITADTEGTYSHALFADTDITINGGTVSATTATGSNAIAINANGDFIYNGGNVTATGDGDGNAIKAVGNGAGGNYTFNWRTATDRITIGTTGLYATDGTTATFSRLFTDGTNIYNTTLTGTEISVLAGKTLQPCTAYRAITGYDESTASDHWTFIATPVAAGNTFAEVGNLIVAEPDEENYDLYRLNNTLWENSKNTAHPDFTALVNGTGYLYANKNDVQLIFTGTPNTDATKTVPLSEGWNLVGNPFAENATINRSYYVMNSEGTGLEATEVYASTPIAPCTGVIVQATGTSESVTFTKVTRGEAASGKGRLSIALRQAQGSALDNAIVSFDEGSQLGKFYFMEQDANLCIPQDGEEYAIACGNGQGEIPLNIKARKNGEYTITVKPEGVEMGYLHLIDHMTGADVDLLATGPSTSSGTSYSFTAKTTDYASRFRLVFSANASAGSASDEPFAYNNGNEWVVANEGCATMQVIDVMGRMLSSEEIHSAFRIPNSAFSTPGVYVLRLINGNDVKTQKIVVR